MRKTLLALLPLILTLAACDQVNQRLGLEDPAKKEARQDAEGKAVGSACRQSGRAIEDCYAIYYWLPKASIFAGWREMNDYMLANKLEVVQPVYEPPLSPEEMRKKRKKAAEGEGAAEPDGEAGKDAASGVKGTEQGAEKPAAEAKAEPEGKPAAKP